MGADEGSATRVGTKRERTERELKDAARRVLSRDGYVNTKIGDIAEEAGKATGLFYKYFKNKEGLLLSLADEFRLALRRNIRSTLLRGEDPFENLRNMISAFCSVYKQFDSVAIAVFQASMVDESFAVMWKKIRAEGIRISSTRILLLQRMGFFIGIDPNAAASILCSMIEFTCYNWAIEKKEFGEFEKAGNDDILVNTLTNMVVRMFGEGDEILGHRLERKNLSER